ncbi:MAG: cupredoxin domain-containing protein [Chloroflexota bacterium]|nr:MAG: cupredoxin domain-containing protein [Chloroflexota bacterium]
MKRSSQPALRASKRLRIGLFLVTATVVIVLAGTLAFRGGVALGSSDATVEISMGGFSPRTITVASGRPTRVELVNPDSAFHTDGGGWHQLAIPALAIDGRVAPRGRAVVDLPAVDPGEYPFYCDICCGGKENPSMQGVLRIV